MPRDTDLYADSCHRVAVTHTIGSTASVQGVDGLIEAFASTLKAARWAQVSSGVSGGHPFYKLVSEQAPWWDDERPAPSDYVGKIKVHIHGTSNANIQVQATTSDDSVQQSEADNRTLVNIAFADGLPYRIIACPYHLCGRLTTVDGLSSSILASVLHTPRFLQERQELKEVLFASRNAFHESLASGSGTILFSVVKDKDGTKTNDAFGAGVFGPSMVGVFPGSGAYAQGRIRAVNAKDDPTFADPTQWFPLASPPMVVWGTVGQPALTQNVNKMRGWLWDSIVLSESYPRNYTMTLPDGTVWEAYTLPNNSTQTLFVRSL